MYIALVYLPFTADFYLYFLSNGFRGLTSYVALEAVCIMTIIAMMLLVELLTMCNCTGIQERDLASRSGLKNEKKKGGKYKRRALRSGMGNEEADYDDEYDSEFDEFEEMGYAAYYETTKKGLGDRTAGEPEGPKSPRDRGKQPRRPGDEGSQSEEDLDSDDIDPAKKKKKKKTVEPDDSPAPGGSSDEDFSEIRKTGSKSARNKSGKLKKEEEKRIKKQKKEDEARLKKIKKEEDEREERDAEEQARK